MFQVNPLIHMKNQALFSWKDKSKKLKCHLLQFSFGPLRVKNQFYMADIFYMNHIFKCHTTIFQNDSICCVLYDSPTF